jgi:hypothetical protein
MTDWVANESSPWYRDFLEKLSVDQLVKECTILWNPKVHYGVHKSLQFDPILYHLNLSRPFAFNFSKIHFNIIISYVWEPG